MMIKKILAGVLVCVMTFISVGCSNSGKSVKSLINNEVTSAESKQELSEAWLMDSKLVQDYFSRKNLTIQSLVINNTYTEGRQSTAYVHIVAENEIARLSINCAIESTKYDNDNWEVTNIYEEEKEIYFPVSDPEININFDDCEVVVESIEKEDKGDKVRCYVYYTCIYDGDVACIEEKFYRYYHFNKETGEGWVYYDGLRDECLGGSCELKSIETKFIRDGDHKGEVEISLIINDNSITIEDLQAIAQNKKISLLNDYNYSNMKITEEYYKGINSRLSSSPCEYDYSCEFKLYYNSSGMASKATGTLFITPDDLWLRIFVPSIGYEKYLLIG